MISYEGFLQEFLQEWRHLDAVPGQSNGFLKELVPAQLPVLSVDGLVASQFSRNADPLAACRRQTGTRAEKKFGFFPPPVALNEVSKQAMVSEPHFTCAHPECRGTVAQQVHLKLLRDRLSEVVDFDVSWKQISVRGLAQVGKRCFEKAKNATSFIPDSDYGASSNAHALRIDHRGAQKSCNGAIYR